ncbi:MAG: hypothetical protein C0443_02630 [Comamonadaceae bacterium]|nr:hypothetical protein [Comamonadaceae bacterium]
MHKSLLLRRCWPQSAPLGLLLLTTLLASPAQAGNTAPPSPAEWSLTPDGGHFLQRSTQLVWPRCVEGQRWSGQHCVGEPRWLNHTEAQALARSRAQADGVAWRLPHLKELQQLARLSTQKPVTGKTTLPDASQGWSWSATAPINMHSVNAYSYDNIAKGLNGQTVNQMKFLHGWAVNTGTGEARNDVLKRTPMMVRLVRPAD